MERPILFNTEMTKDILEGRKTQTRRIIKPQPKELKESCFSRQKNDFCYNGIDFNGNYCEQRYKPPCQVGDILWVRETWKYYEKAVGKGERFRVEKFLAYKADDTNDNIQKSCEWYEGIWRPSIHMPRKAARLFLGVTNVRVERLQDITEQDAINEGCTGARCDHPYYDNELGCCTDCYNSGYTEPPQLDFLYLWNSTIKKQDIDKYGWNANPHVWVVEFEVIRK